MEIAAIAALANTIITTAPYAIKAAQSVREFVASLAKDGQISVADQAALKQHIDGVEMAVLSNRMPPEFSVEPDPMP